MEMKIVKTGLDVVDTCRAYGAAVILHLSLQCPTTVTDIGSSYLVEAAGDCTHVTLGQEVLQLLQRGEGFDSWSGPFLTYSRGDTQRALASIQNELTKFCADFSSHTVLYAQVGTSNKHKTLPSGVDPISSKGLKGKTLSDKSPKQTGIHPTRDWALTCIGARVATRYKIQKSSAHAKSWDRCWAVLLLPERVSFGNFRVLKERVATKHFLNYLGAQHSAAHYAILVGQEFLMAKGDQRTYADRFSKLIFFSLMKTQQWRPSLAGSFSIRKFITFCVESPHLTTTQNLLAKWDELFRAADFVQRYHNYGADLSLSLTELILNPSLTSYERHLAIVARYKLRDQNRKDGGLLPFFYYMRKHQDPNYILPYYDSETLGEVFRYVEDFCDL